MKIPVYYSDDVGMNGDEWISLSKPKDVMKVVGADAMAEVRLPEPLPVSSLVLVHAAAYVGGVLSLKAKNGFGNTRHDVLKQILAANACMVSAARAAVKHGVAFAPVSGFHHAGYDSAWGFCTFNGLMIAARSLLSKKMVSDVLILDFDGHYGDGTNNIINSLGMESVVRHMTRTQPFGSPDESIGWALAAIEKKPGIVLLQAGADSLINDPFGAGYFTDEQWVSRDRMIFEVCRELRVPIVWNLAGGYNGQITIDMHVKTWESAKYVWS